MIEPPTSRFRQDQVHEAEEEQNLDGFLEEDKKMEAVNRQARLELLANELEDHFRGAPLCPILGYCGSIMPGILYLSRVVDCLGFQQLVKIRHTIFLVPYIFRFATLHVALHKSYRICISRED